MFLSEIRWIAGLLLTPVLLFGTEFLRNGSLDKPDTEGRSPRSWIIPSEVKRDYREKAYLDTDMVLELRRSGPGILLEQKIDSPIRKYSKLILTFQMNDPSGKAELEAEYVWMDRNGEPFSTTSLIRSGTENIQLRPDNAFALHLFRIHTKNNVKVELNNLSLNSGLERKALALKKRLPQPAAEGTIREIPLVPFSPEPAEPLRILLFATGSNSVIDLIARDMKRQFGFEVDVVLNGETYDPEQVQKRFLAGEYALFLVGTSSGRYLENPDDPVCLYLRNGGGALFLGMNPKSYGQLLWKNGDSGKSSSLFSEVPMKEISPVRQSRWGIEKITGGEFGKGYAAEIVLRDRIFYRHGIWPAVDEAYLTEFTANLQERLNFNWPDYYSSLYAKLLLHSMKKWVPAPEIRSEPDGTFRLEKSESVRAVLYDNRHKAAECPVKNGTISLPDTLPDGRYFLTVQSLDRTGKVRAWSTQTIDRKTGQVPAIAKAKISNRSFSKGETLKAEIEWQEVPSAETELLIGVSDAAGRLLLSEVRKVSAERKFTVDITVPPSMLQLPAAEVSLQPRRGRALGEKHSFLCYIKPDDPDGERLRYIAAGYLWIPLQHRAPYLEIFRQLGINTENCWLPASFNAALNGFRWTDGWGGLIRNSEYIYASIQELGIHGRESYGSDPIKKHWRNECLSDPRWGPAVDEAVRSYASLARENPPYMLAFADEMTLSAPWSNYHAPDSEPCRMTPCMRAFRQHLRRKYETVERLNRVWGTSFRDFESVVPSFTKEVRGSGNYASWLEFRLFMDSVFAGTSGRIVDAFRKTGSSIVSGQPNWTWMSPTAGIDPSKIVPFRTGSQDYGPSALVRSFRKKRAPVISWLGYSGSYSAKNSLTQRLWGSLNNGATGVMLYQTFQKDCDSTEGYLSEAGAFSEHGKMLRDALTPLSSGAGDFINRSERSPAPVTMLYVHGGMGIAWLESGDETPFNWSRRNMRNVDSYNSWFRSMEQWEKIWSSLCLGFDYTMESHLKERLKSAKVLVLPMCYALSSESRTSIAEFQRNGGFVIGDLNTGLFDENGSPIGNAFMEQIFSVRVQERPDYRFEPLELNRRKTFLPRGGKVNFTGAEPHGTFDNGTPVFLLSSNGRGFGLFCNCLPEVNSDVFLEAIRELLRKTIRLNPPFSVVRLADGKMATGITAGEFNASGATERLILITGDAYDDGRLMKGTAPIKDRKHSVLELKLPKEYYVYNLLNPPENGKKTDSIRWNPENGVMTAYISEQRQNPPSVELSLKSVSPGNHFRMVVGSVSPRIFHRRIYAPDGSELWAYRMNSPMTSLWEEDLGVAWNAKPGIWKIVITDAVTGLITEREISIQ